MSYQLCCCSPILSITLIIAMKAAMSKPARPGSIRLAGVSGDTEMIVNGEYYQSYNNTHPFNVCPLTYYLIHILSHTYFLIYTPDVSGDTEMIVNGEYYRPYTTPPLTLTLSHTPTRSHTLPNTRSFTPFSFLHIPSHAPSHTPYHYPLIRCV